MFLKSRVILIFDIFETRIFGYFKIIVVTYSVSVNMKLSLKNIYSFVNLSRETRVNLQLSIVYYATNLQGHDYICQLQKVDW